MEKLIYLISLLILFFLCNCNLDDNIIILDKHKLKNEIKTKVGLIVFQRDVETNFDLKFGNNERNTVFHIILENTNNLNLEELKEKYKKYHINIFFYQLNILRIVSHKYNTEIRDLLITEVLYQTGYINKKIYSVGDIDNYIYFGGIPKNFKYYKKFILNKNDIISKIEVDKYIIDIKRKKYNFFDLFFNDNFISFINDNLRKFNDNDDSKYSNLKIKIGNKIIFYKHKYCNKFKYNIVDNQIKGLKNLRSFMSNFIYREYNLEKGEVNLYLDAPKDIIEENKEIILNNSSFDFMIFVMVVLIVVFIIIINYHKNLKNNKFLYSDNLYHNFLF